MAYHGASGISLAWSESANHDGMSRGRQKSGRLGARAIYGERQRACAGRRSVGRKGASVHPVEHVLVARLK